MLGTLARHLRELHLIPVAPVRDAVEERVVLRRAHRVDRDVEVPVLPEVVDGRRRALAAVRAAG